MNYKLRDLGLTLIDKFNKEQSRLTNLQFLVQKERFLYLCTHKPNDFLQHKAGVLMTKYLEDYLLLKLKKHRRYAAAFFRKLKTTGQ